MNPLARLYAAIAQQEAERRQMADPNTPHFLSFGDGQVQLVGERPRVNMNYRDPEQAGPAPPTMASLASMYGARK